MRLVPAAAAALLTLALASPASAAGPKKGIYDCTTGDGTYVSSVKIAAKGRSVHASGRSGRKLRQTTKGRFKVSGKTIRWTKGTFKRAGYVSELYDGYFSLDRKADGVWTGISCNHLPSPTGAVGV